MITKIDVKNFKNFEDFELELKPLNVLIGANGTGKSNFVKLIQLYKEGMDLTLQKFIDKCGGTRSLLKDFNLEKIFEIGISSDINTFNIKKNKRQNTNYYYKIYITQKTQYAIPLEKLFKQDELLLDYLEFFQQINGVKEQKEIVSQSEFEALLDKDQEEAKNKLMVNNFDELFFPQIDQLRSENLDFFNFFKNSEIYNEFAIKFGSEMRRVQFVKREATLEKNGDNLINVLNTLYNGFPEAKDSIKNIMSISFDNFKDLIFPPQSQGQVDMEWQHKNNKSVSTYFLSDGQLKFLCLLAILYNPNHKGLICIEEPELYLHTSLHKILGEVLKEASQTKQIIVTTHSPDLLNALEPEDICVLNANKETGYTNIKRLDSKGELESWLRDYELGQLWKMGEIGGN